METSPAVCLYGCNVLGKQICNLIKAVGLLFFRPFIFMVTVRHLAVRPHLSKETSQTLTVGELLVNIQEKMLNSAIYCQVITCLKPLL